MVHAPCWTLQCGAVGHYNVVQLDITMWCSWTLQCGAVLGQVLLDQAFKHKHCHLFYLV